MRVFRGRGAKGALVPALAAIFFSSCLPGVRLDNAGQGDSFGLSVAAESVVAGQEKLFEELFRVPGRSGWAEFVLELEQRGAEFPPELARPVLEEKLLIGITKRERARLGIVKKGFLNMHVSGTSSFGLSATARNCIEASALGRKPSDYAAFSPQLKPKYALVMPPLGSRFKAPDISRWYGTDTYIIKLDKIRNRVTWAPGDSLDRLGEWARPLGVNWEQGESFAPAAWDLTFIPWSRRALLLALLARDAAETGVFGFKAGHEAPYYNIAPWKTLPGMAYPGPQAKYVEAQIWGAVGFEDVESFIFRGAPPSGEFLEALKANDIAVYDARSGEAVPWERGN